MAIASPSTMVRIALSYLPSLSRGGMAHRLMLRANRARDAQRFEAASVLYEEATRLAPADPRILAHFAHMHSELGNDAGAERLYQQALRLAPTNPELTRQVRSFRAAAEPNSCAEGSVSLVPELLAASGKPSEPGFGVHVRRLGAKRARTASGFARVLSGVEAIHGFAIGSGSAAELLVLIDGVVFHREPLQALPLPASARTKYVFNIWCDVSGLTPGSKDIELRFAEQGRRSRSYRTVLTIAPPPAADHPDSDALVSPAQADTGGLEAAINGRTSVIRSARRSLLAQPRTILVQRADQLGDLVCSIPALRRLRSGFPDARIVLLVSDANTELAWTLDFVDEVVTCAFADNGHDERRTMTVEAQASLTATLHRYRFDIAIDLGEGAGSRPLLQLSGAPFLYGFRDRDTPWLSAGLDINAHDPVNYRETIPPSRKMLALVNGLIAAQYGAAEILPRRGLGGQRLERFGIEASAEYAVLHNGARLAYSRWPHYASLAQVLIERTALQVVLMGEDPIQQERPSKRLIRLPERLAFDDFDALLSRARIFVGNDSGPKHLAALRGTPVVSIHMARLGWNEWGQEQTGSIISRRVPCAGCGIGRNGEECGRDFACIRLIGVEEVFNEMRRLMA
ncbi:MAG: hypothetical protein JOZ16_04550 [Methylobacteriaceae bacterium]|nr:hypothetical protein [Methylobacteriaceae bacterium]